MWISKRAERAERRAYLVNEFCQAMRISRAKAYQLMRDGTLPYFTLGGRRHISADVVEAQIRGELPGQAHRPNPTRRSRASERSDG